MKTQLLKLLSFNYSSAINKCISFSKILTLLLTLALNGSKTAVNVDTNRAFLIYNK